MAKRPTRPRPDDAPAAASQTKRPGRAKPQRELGPEAAASRQPDRVLANALHSGPETISDRLDDAADSVQQAPGDALTANAAASTPSTPNEEQIRARAYEMYLERGAGHGMDFEDWLRAERELKQGR